MFITLISAILVFGIMIAIHEAGHLVAAKSVGVTVFEYAIGMGPKLFSFTKGGTAYSLRLFPIGGYCKMDGEDENSNNPGALCNKSVGARFLVIVSGALMNLVLGFLLYLIVVSAAPGDSLQANVVGEIIPDSPAYYAQLQPGDRIIEVDGKRMHLPAEIRFYLYQSNGREVEVTVQRGNEKLVKKITPTLQVQEQEDANGNMVEVKSYIFGYKLGKEDKTFFSVLYHAYYQSLFGVNIIFYSLGQLLSGNVSLNEMSGPVGIVGQIGQSAKNGLLELFSFTALITINLGIFNLLPLPALDGGRILFLAIELIRRKKFDPEKEGWIHFVGLALLMGLMIIVTWSDISKLNAFQRIKELFGG